MEKTMECTCEEGGKKMRELFTVRLKTRWITFDDRLNQVRVVHLPIPGPIEFHDYGSEKGLYYLKKYKWRNKK